VPTEEKKGNVVSRGIGFTEEAWEELKKVHYPTRPETTRATIVVLIMVFFFALFLGASDLIVHYIMQRVLL
jgi:preprotein translocase SecE subunit